MKFLIYGTLRKDCSNHYMIHRGAKFLGMSYVDGLQLRTNGHYPEAVSGEGRIIVEVWNVYRESTRATIRRMEIPYGYRETMVQYGGSNRTAHIFIRNRPVFIYIIKSGDWVKWINSD